MPATVVNILHSPLKFVDDVFDRLVIGEGKSIDGVLKHVIQNFKDNFVDDLGIPADTIGQIPIFTGNNASQLQNGTLVRYRCLIQDMMEPEHFVSVYTTSTSKPGNEEIHCNLFRENVQIPDGHEFNEDSPRSETGERFLLVGGSNPAETAWVRRYYNDTSNMCVDETDRFVTSTAQCIIKVYQDADELKLNDMVECIGIYHAPESDSTADEENQADQANGGIMLASLDIPTRPMIHTKLPRMHVVHFSKLNHWHPYSKLPNAICGLSEQIPLNRALGCAAGDMRSRLITAFNDHLFDGDVLASEYLLCHLMSAVYARQVTMAVGQFALNIFNVQTNGSNSDWINSSLRPLLEKLIAQVAHIPLSLTMLNTAQLVSKKCYETDRLISGRLQLAKGTELIIDETKLEVGQLNSHGISNIGALKCLIKWQKVAYDFTFNTCDFLTDIRTLIISEGPSILPNDFALPIRRQRSNAEQPNGIAIFQDEVFLDAARIYFALAPWMTFVIDEVMQKRVQDDFVSMRRDSARQVNADYLHRLLILARMLALSSGEQQLEQKYWEKAMRMEKERLERLSK